MDDREILHITWPTDKGRGHLLYYAMRCTEAIHGMTIRTHISLGTQNNRCVSVCAYPCVYYIPLEGSMRN